MESSEIILLRKFLKNSCSQQELVLVEQYIKKGISEEVWISLMDEAENSSDDIFLSQNHKRVLYSRVEKRMAKPAEIVRPVLVRRTFLSGIAASTLIFICAYALSLTSSKNPQIIISTLATGKEVRASDGSQIWINNHSRISYPSEFKDNSRTVELVGEAFFDVTKDSERPFIIATQNISVRALGTSFNVKSYPDDDEIVVTLATGKVRVEANGIKQDITPGEQLRYNKHSGRLTKLNANSEDAYAWREGWLVFNSVSLAEIATTLERWYGVKVVIEDEALKRIRVTLKRKDENLTNVLDIISFTAGVEYEIVNDIVKIKPLE